MVWRRFLAVLAVGFFGAAVCVEAAETTLTVFTGRANATEKQVMQDFTKETGIEVRLVDGKPAELIDAIVNADEKPAADLFMVVDGGILEQAKRKGVFGTTDSASLRDAVPDDLRDVDNAWVGVTTRARVIVYSKERVDPSELSSYAALAGPEWKGRVLVRSSGALYNQSLLASLIAAYGEEAARNWADGIARNLAREPKGGDRDQAKGVAEGAGDVAIMNSYYLGQMLRSDDPAERAAAEAVGVFFPDQDLAGTHINVCGVGIVAGSKHPAEALRLVEYLLSPAVQEKLSAGNNEFPINPTAKKSLFLESLGEFRGQKIDFAELYRNREKAASILGESEWK